MKKASRIVPTAINEQDFLDWLKARIVWSSLLSLPRYSPQEIFQDFSAWREKQGLPLWTAASFGFMFERVARENGCYLGRDKEGRYWIGVDLVGQLCAPTLDAFQSRIGRWALETFGPTPACVHGARMDREMADVHDCVAIGDIDNLGRAIAGVLVVALALADSHGLNLTASLLAEQDDNEASEWVQDSWGQWIRNGDGSVTDDPRAQSIAAWVGLGELCPKRAAVWLCDRGADLKSAINYLVARAGVDKAAFSGVRCEDLTPASRGVDVHYHPLSKSLVMPDVVTGDAGGNLTFSQIEFGTGRAS